MGIGKASVRIAEDRSVCIHDKGVLSAAKGLRVLAKLRGHRQRALGSKTKVSNGDSKSMYACSKEACFRREVPDKGEVKRCDNRQCKCAYASK